MTRVSEVMTQDAYMVTPEQTIAQAALLMREKDVGSVAVRSGDKLVGMLTDRDIAIRAVASDKGPETPVQDVMSGEVKYCYDDDGVDDVALNMAELRVRRLPVINRDKRLVGIIALSNISESGENDACYALLQGVATPH